MGLYSILIRPFARHMDIERASRLALRYFGILKRIPGSRWLSRLIHSNSPRGLEQEVFGLPFYNPVGLGAGLDRFGELYNDLTNFGFSFVEIGPMDADGVRRAVRTIQRSPRKDILALCIKADFLTSFMLAYDFCDFFVFDISDTPRPDALDPVLEARLAEEVYKPVILKLPKLLSEAQIREILDYSQLNGIDGIEARSLEQVRQIAAHTVGRLPIIANNHIESPAQAEEALDAGASLVAVRNGLVREGPGFVQKILDRLLIRRKNERNPAHASREAAQA